MKVRASVKKICKDCKVVKRKGILMTDNVLWNGKVLNKVKDKDSQIIDNYNKKVNSDKRLNSVMLPIRDGITFSMKV